MSSRPDDLNFDEQSKGVESEDGMSELISAFRQDVHEQALRPAWFWSALRVSIRQRTSEPKHGSLRWALGSVFAVAGLGAALLLSGPATTSKTTTTSQKVDDDLLMQQVVEATDGGVPDALAPATLLANEVDRGLKTVVQGKGKGVTR